MPKKSFQKQRIIALREILLERTDENNSLTMDEIIKVLAAHGLEADRRTIVEDIETLIDIGVDICCNKETKLHQYAIVSRDFDLQEIKVLLDCIQVSKFLSQKKTNDISNKLVSLCSKYEAAQLKGQVHRNHIKSDNEGIYRFIDTIHQALSAENTKLLSFKYYQYLPSKKPQYRHDGKEYFVYPYGLVYTDENYYLIACDISDESCYELKNIKHFRIDRMDKIQSIDKENFADIKRLRLYYHARGFSKEIDIDSYTKQNFAMYGGNIERVTIQFPNHMAGVVFDRFGIDIHIHRIDDSNFQITQSIAVSPQFYGWVFGLGKEVKIIKPAHVAQGMKDLLKDTYDNYVVPRNRKKKLESD